jgi:outer membrane receptor protein involved in Fe transport
MADGTAAATTDTTTKPAATPAAENASGSSDDVVYLSPFEVTSEGSIGYQSKDTLAGTRLRTDLKDVANAVQVINSKFLQDTGATNTKSLLIYTTNTEVGGVGGNFANVGSNNNPQDETGRVAPQTNTRVRGLSSADNTRDFYLTNTPWDSYNVDHVDIQRGANSMLFGIGSPSGIVNTSTQGAKMFNEGTVEARVGSYGSVRGSVNVNRVLIDGQLAVRVAALYSDDKYSQKPAFAKDARIYGAVRYDPKWAKIGSSRLSIKMNFENGKVDANRPRTTPPGDYISGWYAAGKHIYNNDQNVVSAAATTSPVSNTDYSTGVYSKGSANYSPWFQYWPTDYSGQAVAMFDAKGNFLGMTGSDCTTYKNLSTTSNSSVVNNGSDVYRWGYGTGGYAQYAQNAGLDGSDIGAWKNKEITDRSVFDWKKKLLDGDNKREHEDWNTYNATATETFFDDAVGFELAYDYQRDTQRYHGILSDYSGNGSNYYIAVDEKEYLDGMAVLTSTPSAWHVAGSDSTTGDVTKGNGLVAGYVVATDPTTGLPYAARSRLNKNAGQAVVTARSYDWSDMVTRRTMRGTFFVDLDLKKYFDPDSLLVRVLGRQVFQANVSRMDVNTVYRAWNGYAQYNNYDGFTYYGTVATNIYLGDLLNTTGGSSAAGANLSNVSGKIKVPSTVTQSVYDVASLSYRTVTKTIYDGNSRSADRLKLWTTASHDDETITDSYAAIWNGYMLENCVVPTVGYRYDTQDFFTSGGAPNSSLSSDYANFDAPAWYLPKSKSDVQTSSMDTTHGNRKYQRASGASTSWGIVIHTPEFINKHLPAGITLSGFFNHSDNFRPDATRTDLTGSPVSSETGKTDDYGFVITALNDRISLKVNWYDTKVKNSNMNDAINGSYILGDGETWAYDVALASYYHLAGSANVLGWESYTANGNQADIAAGSTYTADGKPSATGLTSTGQQLAWLPWAAAGGAKDSNLDPELVGLGLKEWNDYWKSVTTSANQPDAYFASIGSKSSFERQWMGGMTMEEWNSALAAATPDTRQSVMNEFSKHDNTTNYTVTGDTESKGTEFELTGQITDNWNVAINASKTNAVRLSIASTYAGYTANRAAMYQTVYGHGRLWWASPVEIADAKSYTDSHLYISGSGNNGNTLGGDWYSTYYGNYLLQRALLGSDVPELCKWRVNLVTNYTFSTGLLKNVNIGGGYRWADKTVIGYPLKYNADGTLAKTTGLVSVSQYDLDHPYYGRYATNWDAWIGYSHPINDSITWKIQLNVKNLFADGKLIPVAAEPDGTIAQYQIPESRTWYLTNTLTF